jgi:small subunit ribosomal protein S20
MAHTIGALKRLRQNKKRNLRNHAIKTEVKTQIKKVLEALKGKDKDKAQGELRKAESLLDRAAIRGVLHPNNAARRKARLAARVRTSLTSK